MIKFKLLTSLVFLLAALALAEKPVLQFAAEPLIPTSYDECNEMSSANQRLVSGLYDQQLACESRVPGASIRIVAAGPDCKAWGQSLAFQQCWSEQERWCRAGNHAKAASERCRKKVAQYLEAVAAAKKALQSEKDQEPTFHSDINTGVQQLGDVALSNHPIAKEVAGTSLKRIGEYNEETLRRLDEVTKQIEALKPSTSASASPSLPSAPSAYATRTAFDVPQHAQTPNPARTDQETSRWEDLVPMLMQIVRSAVDPTSAPVHPYLIEQLRKIYGDRIHDEAVWRDPQLLAGRIQQIEQENSASSGGIQQPYGFPNSWSGPISLPSPQRPQPVGNGTGRRCWGCGTR